MIITTSGFFKQLVSICTAFSALVSGLVGFSFLKTDDTEAAYRQKINSISFYSNTVEEAVPQTALHDMIEYFFNSPPAEGKTVKKAILIGYDGGRADSLAHVADDGAVKTLLSHGGNAYIGYCGGVNYPVKNTQDTSTAPGWCSILTGKWADVHGITGNGISKSNDTLTLLTTLVEDKSISSSAFYTMWGGHFVDENSTYINEKKYCEDKKLNVTYKRSLENIMTLSATLKDVKSADCSDFIFSILEYQDSTGHSVGFSTYNPFYVLGTRLTDSSAQLIINAIEARPDYETEDWLIILTSDHGGVKTGHGGDSIQERMTFIVTNRVLTKLK